MRVLITGVTGFIGRRLSEVLSEAGHEVWGLSRNPDKGRRKMPQLTEVFAWNPVVQQPPGDSLRDVEAVVHLAGETVAGRWTQKKQQRIEDTRVIGTRNLIKALEAMGRPPVLVSGSAIGFYGERGDDEVTEEHLAGRDFLAKVCRAWEAEARKAEGLATRVVILRTGIVLAPGGGALQSMLLPAKLGLGGPLGSGKQWWSWVHRDDLVNMIRTAIESSDFDGSYNATAPQPMQQREFAKVLGKVLGRPAFMPLPALALQIILGGFSYELLSSKRVIPRRFEQAGFEFAYPELEGALREALGK